MPELALDDEERDTFAGHLDGVCVPELMGREPAAYPGCLGGPAQLSAYAGGCAWSPSCRSAQDAEQRADWQRCAEDEPSLQLLPGPAVHSDLAAFAAFPATDEDRPTRVIEIGLDQRKSLADPQTGAPQHNDQAPQPQTIGTIPRSTHHRDDLLDGRRVRRVAQPLIPRRMASVKAPKRGRRAAAARAIEQRYGLHDVLLGTVIDVSILAPRRIGHFIEPAVRGNSSRRVPSYAEAPGDRGLEAGAGPR